MKALVTGATGVLGANLVRELIGRGWSVAALVRPGAPPRALLGLPIRIFAGDVLDPGSLARACSGAEVVFHAAARFAYSGVRQEELDRVAVDGTRNVVAAAAAAGVRRVVVTSSSVVFGSSPGPAARSERDPLTLEDASGYARSKARQTAVAFDAALRHGIEVVAACPTLTIGPWDYRLAESNAVLVKYLNDPFRMTFPGGCNMVSAADVARGHLLLAEAGAAGSSYILGGENVPWTVLHARISKLCGTWGPLFTATHTGAYLTAVWNEVVAGFTGGTSTLTRDEVAMMGRWYWYDDGHARAIGYRSAPLDEALAAALAWLLRGGFLRPDVQAAIRSARGVGAGREVDRPALPGLPAGSGG